MLNDSFFFFFICKGLNAFFGYYVLAISNL